MTDTYSGDGFMKAYSGVIVNLLNPDPTTIFLSDIAHHLSNICRFNGAICSFYSVAEHSAKVAEAVPDDWKLEALLHDATEAYIHDIIRPLKYSPVFVEYRKLEHIWELAIVERFHLQYPFSPDTKLADSHIQEWERVNMKHSCNYLGMEPKKAEKYFTGAFITYSIKRGLYDIYKEEGSHCPGCEVASAAYSKYQSENTDGSDR